MFKDILFATFTQILISTLMLAQQCQNNGANNGEIEVT